MEKTNEILTIAGKRVEKRYSANAGDCCHKCCFWSDAYGMCRAERADSTPPCKDYDSKEGGFAYFIPAKESVGNKILHKLREFLATATPEELEAKYRELEYLLAPKGEDEGTQKAAEEAAMAYGHKADKDGVGGDDYEDDIEIAFKAGIAWERREFAEKLAEEKFGIIDGFYGALERSGYASGICDAMLTEEDIGTIHKLRDDVYTELSAGKIKVSGKSDINAEVLKRFNEIKFKK